MTVWLAKHAQSPQLELSGRLGQSSELCEVIAQKWVLALLKEISVLPPIPFNQSYQVWTNSLVISSTFSQQSIYLNHTECLNSHHCCLNKQLDSNIVERYKTTLGALVHSPCRGGPNTLLYVHPKILFYFHWRLELRMLHFSLEGNSEPGRDQKRAFCSLQADTLKTIIALGVTWGYLHALQRVFVFMSSFNQIVVWGFLSNRVCRAIYRTGLQVKNLY